MRSRLFSRFAAVLGVVPAVALAVSATAAPSGPPIRIGGTLALTGPLAATALLHKITAEIYVEELNKSNGLLGRPVEWLLLDDQSKPEVTRTLYEKLITIDKVDLLMGPYATGAIIAAMGVAQRYQKMLIHHSFGMPHLAKYEVASPGGPLRPGAEKDGAGHRLRCRGRDRQPAEDRGDRHEQVPVGPVPVLGRARRGDPARAEGPPLSRVRVRHA